MTEQTTDKSLPVSSFALPINSLDAYIANAQRMPMLSHEEEIALSKRLQEENDLEAARKLVISHLRFVIKIARGYTGYGLGLADLIQEGNIGLMKAVKRFDPTVGARLVTFAVHWIKAEIHEFIIRNWRIVKVATTKAQRKLFFNLRRNKQGTWFTPAEVNEVAEALHVSPAEVQEMEKRLAAFDTSFDGVPTEDSDSAPSQIPAQYLEDSDSDPAQLFEDNNVAEQQSQRLSEAFSQLDERSQIIIRHRWLQDKKSTLHDLATQFDVSAERIRQLESQAMKKLKDAIEV
jgi:RNA polymerase sigma-32 factor